MANNTDNVYTNPKENPDIKIQWEYENIQKYKESVYDKISELLIQKFPELENSLNIIGVSSLQKTYKNGKLVSGKQDADMMVVYESDIEANAGDGIIEDAILKWLDFADITQLKISVSSDPPNLVLELPDDSYDVNNKLGAAASVRLLDNVSQFVGINKSKTNINRNKLSEYIDTDFSELNPVTFTHLLERLNKLTQQIPFYRYRTDNFFKEYNEKNVPVDYRIEKFFEEFENIKELIPAGELKGMTSMNMLPSESLFGYGSMTYLLKEIRLVIGDGGIPEWTTAQVEDFVNKIDNLSLNVDSLTFDLNSQKQTNEHLDKLLKEFGAYDMQDAIKQHEAEMREKDTDVATANDKVNAANELLSEYDALKNELSRMPIHSFDYDSDQFLDSEDVIKWQQNNFPTIYQIARDKLGITDDIHTVIVKLQVDNEYDLYHLDASTGGEIYIGGHNNWQQMKTYDILDFRTGDKLKLITKNHSGPAGFIGKVLYDGTEYKTGGSEWILSDGTPWEIKGTPPTSPWGTHGALTTDLANSMWIWTTGYSNNQVLTWEWIPPDTATSFIQSQIMMDRITAQTTKVTGLSEQIIAHETTLAQKATQYETSLAQQDTQYGISLAQKDTLHSTTITQKNIEISTLETERNNLILESAAKSEQITDFTNTLTLKNTKIVELNTQLAEFVALNNLDFNQDGTLNVLDITHWSGQGDIDRVDQVLIRMGMSPVVRGCTDPYSSNYNPAAQWDDSTCGESLDVNSDGGLNVLDVQTWIGVDRPDRANETLIAMGYASNPQLVAQAEALGLYKKGGRIKPVIRRKK